MASIRKEIVIDARPADVWDALRDWEAVHERLVPGFAVAAELDGEDRLVTFFNGTVLRERLVDRDEERRRLVWSIVDGPYAHHNGAAQVFAEGEGQTRFVWISDVLPHDLADRTSDLMAQGITVIERTLSARHGARSGTEPRSAGLRTQKDGA